MPEYKYKETLTFKIPNIKIANQQLQEYDKLASDAYNYLVKEVESFNSFNHDFFYRHENHGDASHNYSKLQAGLSKILGIDFGSDSLSGSDLKPGMHEIYDRFIMQFNIGNSSSELLLSKSMSNEEPSKPDTSSGIVLSLETFQELIKSKDVNYEKISEYGVEIAKQEKFSLAVEILEYIQKKFRMPQIKIESPY